MKSSKSFVFESRQDAESIRDFLESLMQGLEKKHLVFSTDSKEIILSPQGLLDFTVKASRKSDLSSLTINLTWRESDGKASPSRLTVTSE